ncbi:hypothetical protein BMT55_05570 [Listeria newyorkensis]|uniref:Uncharacterized protein n=1 Tax=Listeria newyorkensis TaxID=1497681 RepID=A0ABX4XRJ6_9LIST|nr:hypothetical protein [Listeria newyorkensis]KGL40184.1 hypothetical protein EP58_13605 [Listeria newyorkensis]PNP93462.1 hypothetical protein BMT55_05570 [Listeria newyorkensis]WAO21088.1 hypothetical protein OTR81_12580 [Listeria newyorkensis]SQC55902.1 Uncharacterised protein [Listeria newyorkensis]
METSKLELTKLAQLVTFLENDSSDIKTMLYNLNQLSTEELESVQSYFSGSGVRTFSKTFLQISMASFISGMTVFFFVKFQAELLVFFLGIAYLLACILIFFRSTLKAPTKSFLEIAINRGKYDRIISLTAIILDERYREDFQNALETPSDFK